MHIDRQHFHHASRHQNAQESLLGSRGSRRAGSQRGRVAIPYTPTHRAVRRRHEQRAVSLLPAIRHSRAADAAGGLGAAQATGTTRATHFLKRASPFRPLPSRRQPALVRDNTLREMAPFRDKGNFLLGFFCVTGTLQDSPHDSNGKWQPELPIESCIHFYFFPFCPPRSYFRPCCRAVSRNSP